MQNSPDVQSDHRSQLVIFSTHGAQRLFLQAIPTLFTATVLAHSDSPQWMMRGGRRGAGARMPVGERKYLSLPCFSENKTAPENKPQLRWSAIWTHLVHYDNVPDDMTVVE